MPSTTTVVALGVAVAATGVAIYLLGRVNVHATAPTDPKSALPPTGGSSGQGSGSSGGSGGTGSGSSGGSGGTGSGSSGGLPKGYQEAVNWGMNQLGLSEEDAKKWAANKLGLGDSSAGSSDPLALIGGLIGGSSTSTQGAFRFRRPLLPRRRIGG